MADELNPQEREMADESMVRNLAAQALAIWPQEEPLFRRYALADDAKILDAGCGTGEIASRLARLFPRASVLGVQWEQALEGFRTQMPQRFDTAEDDLWVNAVVVDINERGLADSIEQVLEPCPEP